MSRYRKIDPRIWNDEKFRTLSDRGKLVFLFLLTHPSMTSLGAMRATIPGLAAELGWQEKAFREAFREGLSKGLFKVHEKASCVLVPNFLKYNRPESPNVVKAWVVALDLIPECKLKVELIQQVKAFAEALPEAFAEALPEAFTKDLPKSMPNQEQEQELEQEKIEDNTSHFQKAKMGSGGTTPLISLNGGWPSVKALVDLYNEKTPRECPAVEKMSKAREGKIRLYLRQFPDEAFWEEIFAEIHKSDFLRGLKPSNGHEHFKASLDWLLTKGRDGVENCVKVFEGRYRDG